MFLGFDGRQISYPQYFVLSETSTDSLERYVRQQMLSDAVKDLSKDFSSYRLQGNAMIRITVSSATFLLIFLRNWISLDQDFKERPSWDRSRLMKKYI